MSLAQQILVPHLGADILPYTLNFTGLSAFPAGWTAPNWTVNSSTAKNTPTVGPNELLNNPGFDSDTASWNATSSGTLDSIAGGQSGNCLQITNGAASGGGAAQAGATVAGQWYRGQWYHKNGSASGVWRIATTSTGNNLYASPAINDIDWALYTATVRATTITTYLRGANNSITVGQTSLFDTASLKILSNILAYRNFNAANVVVKASWTIAAGYQSGVVARVSSDGSQYLLAYHDRTTCYLLKVLTGGTTQLISIVTAYAAGANVEIRCNGNTVQLFYNNAQVGTDQTESTLSANTRHGLFSTDVSNTVASFSVVKN